MKIMDYSLYLVTERSLLRGRTLVDAVRAAVAGGVTCVQLREKELETRSFLQLAQELRKALRPLGVPLIINDRLDIALAIGADGIHLGQRDMPLNIARTIGRPDWIVGVSAESPDDAIRAEEDGAGYIGVSPVFATATKSNTAPPLGLDGLRAMRSATRLPLVAIGGIHTGNAREVIHAGADGIAVVSAIMAADNPRGAAEELCREISGARS